MMEKQEKFHGSIIRNYSNNHLKHLNDQIKRKQLLDSLIITAFHKTHG